MVQFKTWKDYYAFIRDYGVFTCLNCHYSGIEPYSDDEEHTDSEYAHLFCMESIMMVRLDMFNVCTKWVSRDGRSLIDLGENTNQWSVSDEVIDKLNEDPNKMWSIEEVREVISNEKLEKQESD